MWQDVLGVVPQFTFVSFAILTLFYVYIQKRYDTLIQRKPTDIIKVHDDTKTPLIGVVIFGMLVVLIVLRHLIKPIDTSFALTLLFITLVIVAIEAIIFKVVAPRILS